MEYHGLTAKRQSPHNNPILELLSTLDILNNFMLLPENSTLSSATMALLRISQMKEKNKSKQNYSTLEGEGVLDTTSQDLVKLESLVTYMREGG